LKKKKPPSEGSFFFFKGWLRDGAQGRLDFPSGEVNEIIPFSVFPAHFDETFLRQKYLEERLSTRQIADQIFSARSTVARYLKRFGIPLRSEDEAHRLRKGQLGYGERAQRGSSVVHKREVDTVVRMQTLRAQGYSYWKIAEVLTAMNVPTKNRKGKWHATTVMKILKATTADANSINEGAIK